MAFQSALKKRVEENYTLIESSEAISHISLGQKSDISKIFSAFIIRE
jgi:hypothetical protein